MSITPLISRALPLGIRFVLLLTQLPGLLLDFGRPISELFADMLVVVLRGGTSQSSS